MVPTDAITGPQRQYCWPPNAISGGPQTSKYSQPLRTVVVTVGGRELTAEPTIDDTARDLIYSINAGH